ncbi:MAG: TfoX/Sxy family protein [Nannocystaceae bacterium]|nr:TfoX/Sxy family protein [Nannocystaceae bacterium]
MAELPSAAAWWAYILLADGERKTYVGVTCDVERRLAQHNGALPGGAKATRAGRPWQVVRTYGPFANRGEAMSAEYRVKLLRGTERLKLPRGAAVAGSTKARRKIPRAHHPLFRAAMPDDARAQSSKMFGGVAAVVNGHLAAGLWADTVVVRLSPDQWARLARKGGQPFVPMGRSVMKDMILLPSGTLENRTVTHRWLEHAIEFTAGLPPKKKAAK